MNPSGADLTGTTTGKIFRVTEVGLVFFSISGITAGTVTIQYLANLTGAAWVSLDSTNLAFTADGCAYAICGSGSIRASSALVTTGTTLAVGVAGPYIQDPDLIAAP